MTDPTGVAGRRASRFQDAVRLLFVIAEGGEPVDDAAPEHTVSVLRTATRLHALDFWVRNPDYFAEALLDDVDARRLDNAYLDVVTTIFEDAEPDLRLFPMIRWRFGAYEGVDDALALLRAHELIVVRRHGTLKKISEHEYFLTVQGQAALDNIVTEAPELAWYRERAKLVALVAGTTTGPNLKLRQKEKAEYLNATWGAYIPSIAPRVRERLSKMQAAT